jgi:hypothetical protein
VLPLTEAVTKLSDPWRLGRRGEKIEQGLESLPRHTAQPGFDYFAAAHEEAASRIGNISLADARERVAAGLIRTRSLLQSPTLLPATAAVDHQINRAAVERLQHLWQQPLVIADWHDDNDHRSEAEGAQLADNGARQR